MTNDTIRADELPFEPTLPWVYYCSACEEHFDPKDTSEHDPMRADDHPPVVTLNRVDVVR